MVKSEWKDGMTLIQIEFNLPLSASQSKGTQQILYATANLSHGMLFHIRISGHP